jgi:hypothetical protein
VLSESSARLGELATQVQLAGVASVVEEMQNVQRDTLAELNTLKVGFCWQLLYSTHHCLDNRLRHASS